MGMGGWLDPQVASRSINQFDHSNHDAPKGQRVEAHGLRPLLLLMVLLLMVVVLCYCCCFPPPDQIAHSFVAPPLPLLPGLQLASPHACSMMARVDRSINFMEM